MPPTTPAVHSAHAVRLNLWMVMTLVALGLALWQWLETRVELSAVQQEVARRLLESEVLQREERAIVKQLSEQMAVSQARLNLIDGKLAEFQGQAEALQELQQELARGREEALLLEVEQAIHLAAQQLQLAGNIPVAILALQGADSRLARLDRPQHIPLRKALAHDLGILASQPLLDLTGLNFRLESLIQGIDALPLHLSAGRPEALPQEGTRPVSEWLQTWQEWLWTRMSGLIRMHRLDQPTPMLLNPEQAFFLRENLKLRLLHARLAVLMRDEKTFRSELSTAEEWLVRFFDPEAREVLQFRHTLVELRQIDLVFQVPDLQESQRALRALQPGRRS